MKGETWCFTSATLSYLGRVRVLQRSLRRYQPDWKFCLCLVDAPPPGVRLDLQQDFDRVLSVDQLGIPDLKRWMFGHDLIELCTAVKGPALQRLLDGGAKKVIYLDPDIAVFADISELERLLEVHDVLLTPHLLEPETTAAAILDNEVSALKHGIFNLGFLAVANRPEGRRFAQWWSDRLLMHCFNDIRNGLFTDQRWCDHAPVFFPSLHVLRDPGYNVASWNVGHRPITIGLDGSIRAGHRPLRFFHFTKVDGAGRAPLERYGLVQRPLLELMKWYLDRLARSAPQGIPSGWWVFGRYRDGSLIPPQHRVAYRKSNALQELFRDPFEATAEDMIEGIVRTAEP